MTNWLGDIAGRWPGDESEAEQQRHEAEAARLRSVMASCADELHATFRRPAKEVNAVVARVRKRLEREAGGRPTTPPHP